MTYVLGVDVGTTYTAAAVAANGRAEIFQLGSHAASVPSVVLLRADGEVLTGEAADRRAQTEPARTAREFKRRLGDPVPMLLGGTPYGAEALYALMLRSVVAQVTQQRGETPGLVVITHPASYGPYKLDLLRQAVRQAEIGDAVLLSEPEAAAIHYADQERVEPGAVVAVYDFGGGTFDAAVLRKTGDRFDLLGEAEGLERLGGVDFDQAILGLVNAATGRALDALDQDDPTARAAANRLRDECRQTKEALSSDTEGVIPVLLTALQTEVRLTREEFEEMVRPRLRETIATLERCVRSAGLTFDQVDRILLVGGSSRIPVVGALVREATGRPTAIDAHPKHAIALGAAIYGSGRQENEPVAAATPILSSPADRSGRAASESAALSESPPVAVAGPVIAFTGAAPPATARLGIGAGDLSRRSLAVLGGVAATLAVGVALGAFFLTRGGGENNAANGGGDVGSAASNAPAASVQIAATATVPPTASPTAGKGAAATVAATATPSQLAAVAASPTPLPAATATATATATAAATATATTAPMSASITAVKISGDRYEVSFTCSGFTPALPGTHVHFYFNTASPATGGQEYGGASPFTGYALADRPQAAQQMCIVAANADHSVITGSGSCTNLPSQGGY